MWVARDLVELDAWMRDHLVENRIVEEVSTVASSL